jgi:hypothetical protein
MGAVLGIAAFGRTQEKLAGTAANTPAASGTPLPAPAAVGSAPLGGNTVSTFTPPPAPASNEVAMVNGKKAPVQPPFPEI